MSARCGGMEKRHQNVTPEETKAVKVMKDKWRAEYDEAMGEAVGGENSPMVIQSSYLEQLMGGRPPSFVIAINKMVEFLEDWKNYVSPKGTYNVEPLDRYFLYRAVANTCQ
uniref:MRG domain-containing protein n=1 Tax=Trichuris muris TaxID=70415 RepID=A0A5S6Q2T8_TRIMR